ncbi:MAG: phosphoribosylanthranilate isomerase, partial [Halobacteriaceae archaeon]
MTREDDLRVAIEAGADAVGFVINVPVDTPREISLQKAKQLLDIVPLFVNSVIVTMPDDPDTVVQLDAELAPDFFQIHNDMSPGDIADLNTQIDAD